MNIHKENNLQNHLIYYTLKQYTDNPEHIRCTIDITSLKIEISFDYWEANLKDKKLFVFYSYKDIRLIDKKPNSYWDDEATLISDRNRKDFNFNKLFNPQTGEAYMSIEIRHSFKEDLVAIFANSEEDIKGEPYQTEIQSLLETVEELEKQQKATQEEMRNKYIQSMFSPYGIDTSLSDKKINDILGYTNTFIDNHSVLNGRLVGNNPTLLQLVEMSNIQIDDSYSITTIFNILKAKIVLALILEKLNKCLNYTHYHSFTKNT